MAVCAITDDEAQQMGIRDRKYTMEQYRIATQNSLSKANLVRSPDLMVLQAFMAYLVRQRSCAHLSSAFQPDIHTDFE
jgi:hypothetical protein